MLISIINTITSLLTRKNKMKILDNRFANIRFLESLQIAVIKKDYECKKSCNRSYAILKRLKSSALVINKYIHATYKKEYAIAF